MNSILAGSLAVIVAALLWSFDGTFLRPSLFSLPSPLVVFLEHLLGFLVLSPFIIKYRAELSKIPRRGWLAIFWVALFGGALGTLFFTKALFLTGFIDTSVVILLQKFQPLFAIVLAAIFLHERFPPKFYWYALLALMGGYLVTFSNPLAFTSVATGSLGAAGFALLAAFAWGSATTFGKYSLKHVHFGLLSALRFAFTVIIMAAFAAPYLGALNTVASAQWQTLVIIVFTSGAAAMYLYYFGLKRIPASLATLCELAWPFSAVIMDYMFHGTVLTFTQLLGAAFLVVAVARVTYLNRSQKIVGVVNAGLNQGDKTGAKTANLDLSLAAKLAPGLYSAKVILGREDRPALLYYGYNILSKSNCLEVHILDFNGDIYGKQITVTTDRYLRVPKKFSTLAELSEQIKKDLLRAKDL